MAIELHELNEQLITLRTIYQDAILSHKPIEEKKKIHRQIEELEQSIADRKELIHRQQSTN